MSIANQKYAFVTPESWQESLISRWPDAPLYGGYRLLVFTRKDLPKLEAEYSDVKFKYLDPDETIRSISDLEKGPFICSLTQTQEIVKYFRELEENT